jgi:hypothetical protein
MAKNLYHSALVKLGPVEVTVKSDILHSKFPGKPDYVVLEIDGEDFNYSFDTPECAAPFEGQKGASFTVVAEGSGKDGTATVTYVGEGGGTPQRKPAARPPARPAARNQPPARPPVQNAANRPPSPGNQPPRPPQPPVSNGARVGAAINKAVDYTIAVGSEWNPTLVWEIASDIMRISERLEQNKLARPHSERSKPEAAA